MCGGGGGGGVERRGRLRFRCHVSERVPPHVHTIHTPHHVVCIRYSNGTAQMLHSSSHRILCVNICVWYFILYRIGVAWRMNKVFATQPVYVSLYMYFIVYYSVKHILRRVITTIRANKFFAPDLPQRNSLVCFFPVFCQPIGPFVRPTTSHYSSHTLHLPRNVGCMCAGCWRVPTAPTDRLTARKTFNTGGTTHAAK